MEDAGRLVNDGINGYDPWALALAEEFRRDEWTFCEELSLPGMTATARLGQDSLWLTARWPGGGGLALRTAYAPGHGPRDVRAERDAEGLTCHLQSPLGRYTVRFEARADGRPRLHWTTTLTPAADLLLPAWPRDVYPLNSAGDPRGARGTAHAGQAGPATALLYLTVTQPRAGSALYVQDLTQLNDFFEATGASPSEVVGGTWPQLGYRPPSVEGKPLPAGRPVIVSDAWVAFDPSAPDDEREAAALFLDLLADLYPHLNPPELPYHDWPGRAVRTLRDLGHCPDATMAENGHRFVLPYVGAEPPDSMVQLAMLRALLDYQDHTSAQVPLAAQIRSGLPDFFLPDRGLFHRYLPSAAEQEGKDLDDGDSWYFYHPLINLAWLVKRGDMAAKELLLASLDFAIRVAHHFEYRWPVVFNLKTLDVLTGPRQEGQPGQTDVAGLYAHLMLECWDLTGEARYLEEAKAAVRALSGLRFSVAYQMNLSAWGAVACLRLYQVTGDAFYRDQAHLLWADLFRHSCLWQSRLGCAKHYPIFMGNLCLFTTEYMAPYECYESAYIAKQYLELAGEDVRPSLRLLLTEFIKHTPGRAFYFFPDMLPPEVLSPDVREGRIERDMSFPIEDLFPDGSPAGETGQEIYGAGMPFIVTASYYHQPARAPFVLFSEYPVKRLTQTAENRLELSLDGAPRFTARLRLLPPDGASLPAGLTVQVGGETPSATDTPEGHREWRMPGGSQVQIRW